MKSKSAKPVVFWLDSMLFAICIMVVIGGVTRLTESGLSMTDWRLIGGSVPPLSQNDWLEKFDLYKGSPQHKIVNPDMTLSEFKGIFWWEYIHRMWGRLLGFLFIIPYVYFWIRGHLDMRRAKLLLIALLLGAAQGFLGWFMVQSGLVDRPWVSPVRLTLHFMLAIFLLSFLFWQRLEISANIPDSIKMPVWLNRVLPVLLTLFILQLAYGGLMAGLRAALDYPSFPTMNGQWIPDYLWKSSLGIFNIVENSTFVQFAHRGLAFALLLGSTLIVIRTNALKSLANWRFAFILLAGLVWIQFLLGIMTVISSKGEIPVFWGVIHQFGAVILVMAFTLCFFVKKSCGVRMS